jgi:hypothetical protein
VSLDDLIKKFQARLPATTADYLRRVIATAGPCPRHGQPSTLGDGDSIVSCCPVQEQRIRDAHAELNRG